MKTKKQLLIIFSVILIFTITLSVYASENTDLQNEQTDSQNQNIVIEPLYIYIAKCNANLSISNNIATCKVAVSGNASATSYVYAYMELQRYNTISKKWVKYDSWQSVANNYTLTLVKTRTITSGKYRIKATVTANTETDTIYSAAKTK